MQVVLATKNAGKLRELKELAQASVWLHLLLAPADFDPEETGSTFLENAIIKATAAALSTGFLAVADDSGLEVVALNNRPGIHSARYIKGSDKDRRDKVATEFKEALEREPTISRQASFVCAMAVSNAAGEILFSTTARWTGRLGTEAKGTNGFGYDPIFYLADKDVTSAELTAAEKNRLSHRGQAWAEVLKFLKRLESQETQ